VAHEAMILSGGFVLVNNFVGLRSWVRAFHLRRTAGNLSKSETAAVTQALHQNAIRWSQFSCSNSDAIFSLEDMFFAGFPDIL
jgi:hypothetical protein